MPIEYRDIVKNPETTHYHVIACQVLWREFSLIAANAPYMYSFTFLPQQLHNTPEELKRVLQDAVDDAPACDAILLGYGLCCNGIEGLTAREVPIVIIRAHDCITFLLGSKERYQTYFDEHAGTYWYSHGWIETNLMPGKARYDATFKHYEETYGKDNAEYLMQVEQDWMKAYTRATFIDLNLPNKEHYQKYTKDCAAYLSWEYDEITGDPSLIEALFAGTWDAERFLVVRKGERVVPSHDTAIIKAVAATKEDTDDRV